MLEAFTTPASSGAMQRSPGRPSGPGRRWLLIPHSTDLRRDGSPLRQPAGPDRLLQYGAKDRLRPAGGPLVCSGLASGMLGLSAV